jgi:uncharacterized protein with PIN domain
VSTGIQSDTARSGVAHAKVGQKLNLTSFSTVVIPMGERESEEAVQERVANTCHICGSKLVWTGEKTVCPDCNPHLVERGSDE